MTCPFDTFLLLSECIPECPEGTHANEASRTCEFCLYPCTECTSSTRCLKCAKPFFLDGDQCVEDFDCPVGTYPDTETNTCAKCYENCLSCIGPNKNQCTDCDNDFMEILTYYGTCNSIVCTEGQYANASYCNICEPLCATCGSPEGCIECIDGSIALLQNDSLVQCQICPKGYQYSSSKQCEGKHF